MRTRRLLLMGVLGLLLVTASGLSQFGQPGGSFKGKSKSGGPPGMSRSSSGGSEGWAPSTGGAPMPGGGPPGMSSRSFSGDKGGGPPGMSSRSFSSDKGGGFPSGPGGSRESSSSSGGFSSSRSGFGSGSDGRRGSSGGWSPEGSSESSLRRYDRDGDGMLNPEELPESLMAERAIWDRDGNGFIDPNEYAEYARARMEMMWMDRGGFPGGSWGNFPSTAPPVEEERRTAVYHAGNLPTGLPSWFTQLDSDRDAQVGLYEWKTSGRSLDEFRRMDRNDDGLITVAELLRLSERPASQGEERQRTVVIRGEATPGSPGSGSSRFGSRGGPGSGGPPSSGFGRPSSGGPPSSGFGRPSSGGARPPGPSSGKR